MDCKQGVSPEVCAVGGGEHAGRQHTPGVRVGICSGPVVQDEIGDPSSHSTNLPSHPPTPLLVALTGAGGLVFPRPLELACSLVLVLGLWEQHLWEPPGASGLEGRRRQRQHRESQGRRSTMAGEAGSCQLPNCHQELASAGPWPWSCFSAWPCPCTPLPPNLALERLLFLMWKYCQLSRAGFRAHAQPTTSPACFLSSGFSCSSPFLK